MFDKILCANDGSDRAFRALKRAITIASENDSELHMVSVEEIDYLPELIEEVREEVGVAARRYHTVLQRAREMAKNRQVTLHTHVLAGHAVRDIVELARQLAANLLVVGAAGHSEFYERMLGSRADRLVHLAPCPVLVVRGVPGTNREEAGKFRKILQANDGSDDAFHAFSLALKIACHDHAELHMVCVEKTGHMPALVEETDAGGASARFDQVVRRARFMAESAGAPFQTHILKGHPALAVVKLASELGADLIVVGASGHSALYDRMIGSRAQGILYHAPCSVLVVR